MRLEEREILKTHERVKKLSGWFPKKEGWEKVPCKVEGSGWKRNVPHAAVGSGDKVGAMDGMFKNLGARC